MTLFKGTQSNRKKNKQASHWTTLQTFQTRDFEFQRRSKMALSFLRIPQKNPTPSCYDKFTSFWHFDVVNTQARQNKQQ